MALGPPTAAPTDPFPGAIASSKYYEAAAVEREISALIGRSLGRWLPAILTGESGFGVGSGSVLLPKAVTSVRTVLLFARRREEETVFLKIASYSLFSADAEGVAKVNAALAATIRPEPKSYYGAKVEQIKKMYAEYVPQQYVPDRFDNPTGGKSGYVRPTVAEMMLSREEREAAAAAKAVAAAGGADGPAAVPAAVAGGKRRWVRENDDARLLSLMQQLNPRAGAMSPKQWKELADKMWEGCEPIQCKTHWKRLKPGAVALPKKTSNSLTYCLHRS